MNRRELYQRFSDRGFEFGAEIGVAYGDNSISLLECFPKLKLYLIDPWAKTARRTERFTKSVKKKAMEKLSPYADRVLVMSKRSEVAALDVSENELDIAYIDGDHSYDAVMLDIVLWGRRVKPGGILAGHDYVRTRKHGVYRAVNDYANYHGIEVKVFEGNWYWEIK